MKKETSVFKVNYSESLNDTKKAVEALMNTPHYKKMGAEGIFAIIEKAKSVGVNPMDALNGGLFFVQGKVEMTSAMMNQLIRACGHSITKDKRSDETICILHGRRADNGDTWVESFSLDDAKKAGIYRNQWERYPKDMLFARALSRLARQLFPDVIKGCYVQGEISEAPPIDSPVVEEAPLIEAVVETGITQDEADYLDIIIDDDHAYRKCVMNFIKKEFDADELVQMPREIYEKILPVAERRQNERAEQEIIDNQQIAIGE